MIAPVAIKSWAVLVCMNDYDLNGGPDEMGSLKCFINALLRGFNSMGMRMDNQPTVVKADDFGRYVDPGRFSQAVTHLLKQARGVEVVFVVIPRRGAQQRCMFCASFLSWCIFQQPVFSSSFCLLFCDLWADLAGGGAPALWR